MRDILVLITRKKGEGKKKAPKLKKKEESLLGQVQVSFFFRKNEHSLFSLSSTA